MGKQVRPGDTDDRAAVADTALPQDFWPEDGRGGSAAQAEVAASNVLHEGRCVAGMVSRCNTEAGHKEWDISPVLVTRDCVDEIVIS
jgi:hypothetical protein